MSSQSILVVDDNPDNRKLARILLERDGFEVSTVEDAEQALHAIETHPPALILMDIQLPGMNGLALTRLLRQRDAVRDVHIVAFSAAAFKGDEELASSAGCDGYITKPIDTRAFAGLVRSYLEGPRAMHRVPMSMS
jgi:two-component system cell cycle response regulator DivK